MIASTSFDSAENAAEKAIQQVFNCIASKKSFLLEAGAGAGKTHSLIRVLRHLIDNEGRRLARRHHKIACITFTNVATEEIRSRTDSHPAIHSDTIHGFCWSFIRSFQPWLCEQITSLEKWPERLADSGSPDVREVDYDLGYPKVVGHRAQLHHDDVLRMFAGLLKNTKFRSLLAAQYPFILVDEYQDTDAGVIDAIKSCVLGDARGPLIGFFGDHWQRIYGTGCGQIDHEALVRIGKQSNFRSVPAIVNVLNRIRPELPQAVQDSTADGTVRVYHTNGWEGLRRPKGQGGHWEGDLPVDVAHEYLERSREILSGEGWDFSPKVTKILMLTHNNLASEQGYAGITKVFSFNEAFIKKEDPYIAFLVDVVEPMCVAYEQSNYGVMFDLLGKDAPAIKCHSDKVKWKAVMDRLMQLRQTDTIGALLDHIVASKRPRMPESLWRAEVERDQAESSSEAVAPKAVERSRAIRSVAYAEIVSLARFIDGNTPFATKHGVKGAEFENVLVVFGRGWNQYNFNAMLEFAESPSTIPSDRRAFFERNRNLFYVACSRPKKRLALLFTQQLSERALSVLGRLFGEESIAAL